MLEFSIKINKKSNRNFESLFLSNFPYVLAENFTFSTENSSNQVRNSNINTLHLITVIERK